MLRDKEAGKGESIGTTDHPDVTTVTPLVIRHKGETKEEKQARKHVIKKHNKVTIIMKCTIFYQLVAVATITFT